MKKKILFVLMIAVLCCGSMFAAGSSKTGNSKSKSSSSKSWSSSRSSKSRKHSYSYKDGKEMGIGVNLGWPGSGLAVRYHSDELRVLGGVAFNYANALCFDLAGEYIFSSIKDEDDNDIIDFSAGAGGGAIIPLGKGDLSVAFEAGIVANHDFLDAPLSIYGRFLWMPTLTLGSNVAFNPVGFGGSIGITYNFELND